MVFNNFDSYFYLFLNYIVVSFDFLEKRFLVFFCVIFIFLVLNLLFSLFFYYLGFLELKLCLYIF